jgi:integrase
VGCRWPDNTAPPTIHGLRHSATSLALAEGAPVVAVAGLLGHGASRLVQERYGHTLPTAHKDAALAVDRALRRGARKAHDSK